MKDTPALSLRDVRVRLGGNTILDGVNADVRVGEFLGIFGPNGAGKSTLMRAILGLCPLSGGTISLFGQVGGKANRLTGYMPQTRASLEGTSLSARALVAAVQNGERWGLPWTSAAARREVDRVLELAGANTYAERPFSVLSGGEKQRVTLAQALLGSPRLLILDEPLASLDPRNQLRLVDQIEKIRRETGTTVLFIAHDINPLLGRMDRVLYVAGGGAEIGTVDDVITNEALSRLYGMAIHVVRAEGRIFIVNEDSNVTEAAQHG